MLDEFLTVLAYSVRTQLAIALGVIFFFAILIIGAHLTSQVEFQGSLAPLAESMRELLMHRYEKAAWGALGAFLVVAFRSFCKDRKRLFGINR